jgi:hypothetical protein
MAHVFSFLAARAYVCLTMANQTVRPKCSGCDRPLEIRQFSDDRNLVFDVPVGYRVQVDVSVNGHLEVRYWCEACA